MAVFHFCLASEQKVMLLYEGGGERFVSWGRNRRGLFLFTWSKRDTSWRLSRLVLLLLKIFQHPYVHKPDSTVQSRLNKTPSISRRSVCYLHPVYFSPPPLGNGMLKAGFCFFFPKAIGMLLLIFLQGMNNSVRLRYEAERMSSLWMQTSKG